jgi:hypothetical protein
MRAYLKQCPRAISIHVLHFYTADQPSTTESSAAAFAYNTAVLATTVIQPMLHGNWKPA